jgi:hypothetical protein
MPSSYTPLLGFVQPSPGELTNTWGGVVNTQLTDLVEDAIASASTQSVTSGDWTLTTDGGGAANQARSAILIATGTPGTTRNIYAPKQDKVYVVINNSNSSVVLKGGPTSPTTGVTVVASGISLIAWNSNAGDFVAAAAGVTSLTAGSGVSVSASTGAVTVANTGVTSAVAGTGIGVSGATGAVTFTNSGVTSLVAGTGISVSGATGAVTVSSTAAGTVTSITAGTGLTGGTITTSGTIALDYYTGSSSTNTSFPIGSYLNVNSGGGVARNGSSTLYYSNALNYQYNDYSTSGTALSGTWRSRGTVTVVVGCSIINYITLYQRTA